MKKILLHIIATNKYDRYVEGIISTGRKYFLPREDVKFVIYTDSPEILKLSDPDIIPIRIEHKPWPYPTLERFHHFLSCQEIIEKSDFSFYIDVDSLFIKEISWESLGVPDSFDGMIGTIHPGFKGSRGTPEDRSISSAYISPSINFTYFCGGFFGGTSKYFLESISTIKENIDLDFSKGIIAIWHDESHLNKYFLENPPSSVLPSNFTCSEDSYPEEGERIIPQYLNLNGVIYFVQSYILFLEKENEVKKTKSKIHHDI
jgi:hypothetical protein